MSLPLTGAADATITRAHRYADLRGATNADASDLLLALTDEAPGVATILLAAVLDSVDPLRRATAASEITHASTIDTIVFAAGSAEPGRPIGTDGLLRALLSADAPTSRLVSGFGLTARSLGVAERITAGTFCYGCEEADGRP